MGHINSKRPYLVPGVLSAAGATDTDLCTQKTFPESSPVSIFGPLTERKKYLRIQDQGYPTKQAKWTLCCSTFILRITIRKAKEALASKKNIMILDMSWSMLKPIYLSISLKLYLWILMPFFLASSLYDLTCVMPIALIRVAAVIITTISHPSPTFTLQYELMNWRTKKS